MDTMEYFSERLKKLREEKGISQTELGEALGISRSSISFYEKSERVPDIELLSDMARYFEVPVDYLLGLSNAKSTNEPELKAICDYTGLNEHSVCKLHDLSQEKDNYKIDFFNTTLTYATCPGIDISLLQSLFLYKYNMVVLNKELIKIKEKLENLKIDIKQCENNTERENILLSTEHFVDVIDHIKRTCKMFRYDCIESFSGILRLYALDIAHEFKKNISDCENEIIEIEDLGGEPNGNDNEEE